MVWCALNVHTDTDLFFSFFLSFHIQEPTDDDEYEVCDLDSEY